VASIGQAGYGLGMTRFDIIVALAATAGLAAATPVHAEETLPGVSGEHSIVKPLPEPAENAPREDDAVKMGSWDVKISGSVTVDIGTDNLRPPHR